MVGALKRILAKGSNAEAPWRPSWRERSLLRVVKPFTMSDPLRLVVLHGLARECVEHNVPGDFVELGVCNGGSAAMIAAAQMASRGNSKLWLYDTFKGIPAAGPEDGDEAQRFTGAFVGQRQRVSEVLSKVGFPSDRTVFREGLFEETLELPRPGAIALLHIDGDWYESVLVCLRSLYDSVSEGGVIVLDDFGYWEGARRAFYTFCSERQIQPLLERVGDTQAFWRKGAETNRTESSKFARGIYHPA